MDTIKRNTVATIAINIPKDAIILPFLAVFGWLSIFRPYINDTADSK